MEDVVSSGTGYGAGLSNMTTAGKTGSTDDYADRWFVGFTPYYTAGIWGGYDDNKSMEGYGSWHLSIWHAIMERIHQDLEDKDFEMPSSVVQKTVCTRTGLLAVSGCPSRTDYFDKDTAPTESCSGHGGWRYSDDDYSSGTDTNTGDTMTTIPAAVIPVIIPVAVIPAVTLPAAILAVVIPVAAIPAATLPAAIPAAVIPVVIPGAAIPAVGMPVEVPAEIPGAVIPAAEMPVVIPQQNKKRKNPFLKSADFRNGFFFYKQALPINYALSRTSLAAPQIPASFPSWARTNLTFLSAKKRSFHIRLFYVGDKHFPGFRHTSADHKYGRISHCRKISQTISQIFSECRGNPPSQPHRLLLLRQIHLLP